MGDRLSLLAEKTQLHFPEDTEIDVVIESTGYSALKS